MADTLQAEQAPSSVPLEFRKKDGSLSKMRSHAGNIPVLPQTKLCPHCPAKFTRTTHLNRHLRTHTNERVHCCDTCGSQFTRSDLLTRHKKSCNDQLNRPRRKSCVSCTESKIKCDRQYPCSKCATRGKECVYATVTRKPVTRNREMLPPPLPSPSASHASTSSSPLTPPTPFARAPDALHSGLNGSHNPDSSPPSFLSEDLLAPDLQDYKYVDPTGLYDYRTSPGSDIYSSSTSDTTLTSTEVDAAAVNSHLSNMYSSDMFEPLFSNIFSQSPSPPRLADAPASAFSSSSWPEGADPPSHAGASAAESPPADMALQLDLDFWNMTGGAPYSPSSSSMPASTSEVGYPLIQGNLLGSSELLEPELQQYLYLFFSAFSIQMPFVHPATFNAEGKPAILLKAMGACGALFLRTRKAAQFVSDTLACARHSLMHEFAKNPTDSADVVDLILAVVLLQTIGLFHQKSDERASSSIYHGMLIIMIRRTGLVQKNASWQPGTLDDASLEAAWNEWAFHEMSKRALLQSYLHDTCQCIYFAMPPSYHPSEVILHLPCEDALWKARSAQEWRMVLEASSVYGPTQSRLVGASFPQTLAKLSETQVLSAPLPLNPFSHFIVTHGILRHLFSVCCESRSPRPISSIKEEVGEGTEQEIFRIQYTLHNWLQSWRDSPTLQIVGEETPFMENALPFYWLGQVALLAYQEGLPPFEHNSPNNLNVDARFKLVKRWLKHIRGFLHRRDQGPTLFWDELMKIRLQTWQLEVENDPTEDPNGLLEFFPEY